MSAMLMAASVAVPAASQAGPAQPLCLSAKVSAQNADPNAVADTFNTAVINMRRSGKSQQQIDKALQKDYGLELVGSRVAESPAEDSIGIMKTTTGNLSIPSPSIYRETCTGRYHVFAYWDFNSIPQLRDDANHCSNCGVGPVDLMALRLSRDVADPGGYSVQSWGATSAYRPASRNIVLTSSHGFGMEDQDRSCSGSNCGANDYNMYHGQMVMGIDVPGCGPLTAFSQYGHSRSGVVLTGFSIGIDSIGMYWSNNTYAWNKASQASNTVWPC